jgi:hypothetical protein
MAEKSFRVRLLYPVSDPPAFDYKPGDEADVHPDVAINWIKAGFAELVSEEPKRKKKQE